MAIPNFPNGFAQGVMIRNVPLMQTNPGKVFWLSNNALGILSSQRGGSDGNRGDFNSPFATLAGALAQCFPGRGDIIMVKPGHAETISSATALALNVAGVAIIGMGTGSARPKFTLDTANTSTITVSADNISVQNCQFIANFLSIAACFTLTTAKEFVVQNCLFKDASGVLDFLNIIKSTGAANTVDGLTFTDNVVTGLGTTSVNATILSANDIDRLTFQRNRSARLTTVDAAEIVITAGVVTNADLGDNCIYRKNAASANGTLINVGGSTSTGWAYRNHVQSLTTSADKLFTTTSGLGAFSNYVSGVVGASGFLIPTADS